MRINQSVGSILATVGLTLTGSFLFCGFYEALPGPSVENEVVEVGKEVAAELMRNLKSALVQAMQEGGPPAAIQVCKTKALALTEGTAADYPEISVKRTSLKARNPKNRPDSIDEGVLKVLAEIKSTGEELPDYSIREVASSGVPVYRYYQPILTSAFCLNCHGDTSSMSQEVSNMLKREYPEDQAVGYKSGDLRGVISVEIPAHTLSQD
jgi:hypothetical protein